MLTALPAPLPPPRGRGRRQLRAEAAASWSPGVAVLPPPSSACPTLLPLSSAHSLTPLPALSSVSRSLSVSPAFPSRLPFSAPSPLSLLLPALGLSIPSPPFFTGGLFALPGQSAVTPRQPPRREHRTPPWARHAPLRGWPGPRDPRKAPPRAASPASPSPQLSGKLLPSCLLLLPFISWRARAAKGTACGQRSRASTPWRRRQ